MNVSNEVRILQVPSAIATLHDKAERLEFLVNALIPRLASITSDRPETTSEEPQQEILRVPLVTELARISDSLDRSYAALKEISETLEI